MMNEQDRHTTQRETISLRDHFEFQLYNLEKLMLSKIASIELATKVVNDTMQQRFGTVNEWRGVVTDLVDGKANCSDMTKVEDDIRVLREAKATLEGKASQESVNDIRQQAAIGLMLGVVSLLVAIGAIIVGFLKP